MTETNTSRDESRDAGYLLPVTEDTDFGTDVNRASTADLVRRSVEIGKMITVQLLEQVSRLLESDLLPLNRHAELELSQLVYPYRGTARFTVGETRFRIPFDLYVPRAELLNCSEIHAQAVTRPGVNSSEPLTLCDLLTYNLGVDFEPLLGSGSTINDQQDSLEVAVASNIEKASGDTDLLADVTTDLFWELNKPRVSARLGTSLRMARIWHDGNKQLDADSGEITTSFSIQLENVAVPGVKDKDKDKDKPMRANGRIRRQLEQLNEAAALAQLTYTGPGVKMVADGAIDTQSHDRLFADGRLTARNVDVFHATATGPVRIENFDQLIEYLAGIAKELQESKI